MEVACAKCPDNLHTYLGTGGSPATLLTGRTSPAACLTTPGWGYFDGSAQQCDYATYSTGYSQVGPQHCHCGQVTCGMRNF